MTRKERQMLESKLKNQISALIEAVAKCSEISESTFEQMINEKRNQLKQVMKKKEYLFNFESGGWNSVYARDITEAIELAKEQYNETEQRYHCEENGGGAIPLTRVDEDSFRVSTDSDLQNLMSLFY